MPPLRYCKSSEIDVLAQRTRSPQDGRSTRVPCVTRTKQARQVAPRAATRVAPRAATRSTRVPCTSNVSAVACQTCTMSSTIPAESDDPQRGYYARASSAARQTLRCFRHRRYQEHRSAGNSRHHVVCISRSVMLASGDINLYSTRQHFSESEKSSASEVLFSRVRQIGCAVEQRPGIPGMRHSRYHTSRRRTSNTSNLTTPSTYLT